MAGPSTITIRGAREHNLRGVDLTIPRNRLVVFTGVSGSGKSSLAYDTLYKEGQRRFMESLSAYARQFLGQMERPDVEAVDGISPTLSIDQKTVNRNPRSTVGTVTEIYDHLRLLMARLGTPHCPACGREVSRLSVDQVVDRVLEHSPDARLQVLGPVVRDRKGQYRKELEQLARDGWVRARVDGEVRSLDESIELARYEKHTIEVVVDRLRARPSERTRLAEAVETASRLGGGVVTVLAGDEALTFSTERACPEHPEISIPELEPRLFSFNAPQGACAGCEGLGVLERFEVELLVDHDAVASKAYNAFNDEGRLPFAHFDQAALKAVIKQLGGPTRKKVRDWPEAKRERLLFGDPDLFYVVHVDRGGRREKRERPWRGLVGMAENIWKYTGYSGLKAFRERQTCPDCDGHRLNPVSLAVTWRDKNVHALSRMSVQDAHAFFAGVRLRKAEREIGSLLLSELRERLAFLHEVGLDYLSLDRSAATLSGGEAQRIRLAAQVGSALQGVTYVLDEPSIGLHARDNQRLLGALRRLRDRGNSVLVVEHDTETILAADYVVDVGPGAGREGGHVVAHGPPAKFLRSKKSLTAKYLRGELGIEVPERRGPSTQQLTIRGARIHNLDGLTVGVPLGRLVVVTGVSGSGKSSLVFQVLERSLRADKPVHCEAIDGRAHIDKLIRISQQPIGRTPRSNPATYTGAFDPIRSLFAATPEARARGYKKGRFSFNVAGGRCEACEGAGVKTVEMQFLPSVEVVCEVCAGKRFNPETLEITWRGHTISDILQMTVSEARAVFENVPKLNRILGTMEAVGLDYVSLGQPSTTLSGGEAQRVKLATELHRPATGGTLYLLDEPTTGLHTHDVRKLVDALQRLVDAGNTVVVIEHHTDVIKCADHLIDLGPEGGTGGGQIVGQGPPEHLATLDTPTGRVLAALPELRNAPLLVAEAPRRPRVRQTTGLLEVKGARAHNLQGIDVAIPHGAMTVVTGVSGSGKSSLAFDTVFSEGQRQYVESLSTYARRFLGRLERAPVERVSGLKPAIAIDQRNASHNPRSTVATVTEIHDVLRLIYARVGLPHCPKCKRAVRGWSASEAAGDLAEQTPDSGWLLTPLRPVEKAPAGRRKGLEKDGWTRLFDEGAEISLSDEAANVALTRGVDLVVDRVRPAKTARSRVSEAIAAAYAIGGEVRFQPREGGAALRYTPLAECPEHGPVHGTALTPRHFSFNSRLGACPRCEGLGVARALVPERLFPAPKKGFWDALDPRVAGVLSRSARNRALVDALLEAHGLTPKSRVDRWSQAVWDAVMEGDERSFTLKWTRKWGRSVQSVTEERSWPGLEDILSGWSSRLEWLTAETTCPACHGGRLRRELLAVTLGGLGIHELSTRTVDEALEVVRGLSLTGARATIAERALLELRRRLGFLVDVGLGYLPLDRSARTLSGGESQRIRLASQLGSQLTGVVYVLDEPTIGLHPRDTARLLDTLEGLRDLGNTVIIVEHDPDTIVRADHVLDMGPAAGQHGGQLVASGTPDEIRAHPDSVTGAWLRGERSMPARGKPRKPRTWLTLKGATANNLQGDAVKFPTGVWTAITGVSGSGKSSLVMDTLAPALQAELGKQVFAGPYKTLELGEAVDKVVVVDQSPIGRSPRSTAATYTGVMDKLRTLFAQTLGARERGWKPGRFSFNSKTGGRCEACDGRGATLVEMHFLPDVWVTCEACRGRRYGRETLEVRWQGHSIADVLAMRCDEAVGLFTHHRNLKRPLQALVDVGLGYLSLGQPGTTLSGGEAQRVKLASELTSRKGHCVYVLDEPTTGLHLSDVADLVGVLHRLVDNGHTVLTIEHHLDVVLQADWVIDMGPEGGKSGGRVIGAGTVPSLGRLDTPTGRVIARQIT